jgi:prefoldin subunit 5
LKAEHSILKKKHAEVTLTREELEKQLAELSKEYESLQAQTVTLDRTIKL